MKLDPCHLIVFAKAPIPGQVKTRLIPSLGPLGAAKLYERLMLHTLAIAVNSKIGPVDLWCSPSTEHPFFIHCAEEFHVELFLQPAGDLGHQMAYAFQRTLKATPCALLIGTDCPSLTQEDLREALSRLQQGYNAVISPTEDGGYALMGLHHLSPVFFEGISWGTEVVLDQTRQRLHDLGWRWYELPKRWDVDRPEDVERLLSEGVEEPSSYLPPSFRFTF
jgi:hypothetical protein